MNTLIQSNTVWLTLLFFDVVSLVLLHALSTAVIHGVAILRPYPTDKARKTCFAQGRSDESQPSRVGLDPDTFRTHRIDLV